MTKMRVETETMGQVEAPTDACFAAQTVRSMANFPVGKERIPREIASSGTEIVMMLTPATLASWLSTNGSFG